MDLNLNDQVAARLHAHHYVRRAPDWTAAAVAGFLAGAVLMTLQLFWVASSGGDVWRSSHQVAAIVMGRDALQTTAFSWSVVITALAIHYVLGMAFGMVLALIVAPFNLDSSWHAAALVGALFGVLLYVINFYGMSQVFSWFDQMRGPVAFTEHVVFGVVAALAYRQLERPVDKQA